MSRVRYGFMCSIDYEYHLENDWYEVPIYSSMRSIKHHKKCVNRNAKGESCGIVRVRIGVTKVMQKEKLYD